MKSSGLANVLRYAYAVAGAQNARSLSDEALLEEYVHGNAHSAITSLVHRHGPMVMGVCRRMLASTHDADDAFQATFLVLVRQAKSIRKRKSIAAWLYGVAYKVSARLRMQSATRRHRERQADPMPTQNQRDEIAWQELLAVLDEELARLPEKYREPIILCHLEGKTQEQAARELGWPRSSFTSRIGRARQLLELSLRKRGIDLAPAYLGVLLAEKAAPVTVPVALSLATVKVVTAMKTGALASAKVISARAVALSEEIGSLFLSGSKVLVATVVGSGLVLAGLGFGQSLGGIGQDKEAAGKKPQPATKSLKEIQNPNKDSPLPANPEKAVNGKPIQGTVVDEEGRPVQGATVVLGRIMGHARPVVTRTDASGRFEFTGLPGDRPNGYAMMVAAGKAGYAPAREPAGVPPMKDPELILTAPVSVAGSVKDNLGQPIALARVQFGVYERRRNYTSWGYAPDELLRGTPLEQFFVASTNAEGRFEFASAPLRKELIFRASASGFGDLDTAWSGSSGSKQTALPEVLRAKPAGAPVELKLLPEAKISGRVISRVPGVGIQGLRVWVDGVSETRGLQKVVITSANGEFAFEGLPQATFNVFLEAPPDSPWTARVLTDVSARRGQTAKVQLELVHGVLVEGQVIRTDTGAAVAGVAVEARSESRPTGPAATLHQALTDDRGGYRMRLLPGEVTLFLRNGPKELIRNFQWGKKTLIIPENITELAGPTLTFEPAKPKQPDTPTALTIQFRDIKRDSEAEEKRVYSELQREYASAKNESERDANLLKTIQEAERILAPAVKKIMASMRPHAADPEAAEILAWVVKNATSTTDGNEAVEMLKKHHLLHKETVEISHRYKRTPLKWNEALLRAQLASPDLTRAQRPLLLYALAELKRTQSQLPDKLSEASPAELLFWRSVYGSDLVVDARKIDVAGAEAEAIKLYSELAEKFGSQKQLRELNARTYAENARTAIFETKNLGVGKTAPEIEGVDTNGVPLKLSDFRGKVVLLSFWGTWCGPCMSFVPHERELVERFKNKPFVLIGVNSDADKSDLKEKMEKAGITWRSFWCGEKGYAGDIPTTWNVTGWPKIYVIDHKGIIRAKYSTGTNLDRLLEELVRAAASN